MSQGDRRSPGARKARGDDLIRREKYLKIASRLRQVVVKQGQKINAKTSIKEALRKEAEEIRAELAALRGESFGFNQVRLAA